MTRARHRFQVLLPGLLLLGMNAACSFAFPEGTPAPRTVLDLEVLDGELPAAFLPLADGSLLLLDGSRKQLLRYRSGRLVEKATLSGSDFDPSRAHLVDLAEESPGRILILDAGAGTVWRAGLDGEITGRFGLLVAPTRITRGADGRTYVCDPGSGVVVGFRREDVVAILPLEGGVEPFATRHGELPVLDLRPAGLGLRIGLRHGEGRFMRDLPLRTIDAPAGYAILDARVVGIHATVLVLELELSRRGEEEPTATRLVFLGTEGESRGRLRSLAPPETGGHCLDCGPSFRVGPAGNVWFQTGRPDHYEVVVLDGRKQP